MFPDMNSLQDYRDNKTILIETTIVFFGTCGLLFIFFLILKVGDLWITWKHH